MHKYTNNPQGKQATYSHK